MFGFDSLDWNAISGVLGTQVSITNVVIALLGVMVLKNMFGWVVKIPVAATVGLAKGIGSIVTALVPGPALANAVRYGFAGLALTAGSVCVCTAITEKTKDTSASVQSKIDSMYHEVLSIAKDNKSSTSVKEVEGLLTRYESLMKSYQSEVKASPDAPTPVPGWLFGPLLGLGIGLTATGSTLALRRKSTNTV